MAENSSTLPSYPSSDSIQSNGHDPCDHIPSLVFYSSDNVRKSDVLYVSPIPPSPNPFLFVPTQFECSGFSISVFGLDSLDRRVGGRMQEHATSSIPANSLPSSSERSSSSAALQPEVKEGTGSDEEIRRVPEMGGGETGGTSAGGREAAAAAGSQDQGAQPAGQSQRKRGRSPADKENKRLKRLLRNRVSAQQARERKKAFLNDLEVRVKDLEKNNSELEERVSTLQNENQMLRHILKNTTAGRRGSGGGGGGGPQ